MITALPLLHRRLRPFLFRLLLLLGLMALAGGRLEAATPSANLADFDWLTAAIERNYSGWPTKTEGERKAELDALTARLRAQVASGDEADFRQSLKRWLAWFDDGHLQLQWASAPETPPWKTRRRALDEKTALARLNALGTAADPVEGLWLIDDRYRLAVLRRDRSAQIFDAVILSTAAETWTPGEVKAVLTRAADGSYALLYGAGDRTEVALQARLRSNGDVLDVDELGQWRRVQATPEAQKAAERRWPGDAFLLERIDDATLNLRLPSFHASHLDAIRKLIADNAAELERTPQLIIDVRGNGGGSDFTYDPVLPYLYTRPIWRIGVELRVSADNARLRGETARTLESASPEAARLLASESQRMQSASQFFLPREPAVEIVRLDQVLPNPARIAVLIDRAGSSAENFIMDARQSRKVVLMGQENSADVIDYGEMMGMPAPSGRFELHWATTRSLRLPGDPVDPHGIAPDILIPADVEDPVAYAAKELARRAD
jgi:hypothetical protein